MHILDTDTLTRLHKGNENVKDRLAMAAGFEFATTIVTKAEILRGRIEFLLKAQDGATLEKAQRIFLESQNLLDQIPTLVFDHVAIAKFDELRRHSKYRKIGRNDMLIASICFAHKAVLVTRNVKHFRQFPGLEIENWVD